MLGAMGRIVGRTTGSPAPRRFAWFDPDAVRPVVEAALAESVRTGELWSRTEVTAALGQIAAVAGDDARARELIGSAEAIVRETDSYAIAFVAFSSGRVNELGGRPAEAEASYRRALEVLGQTEYVFRVAWMRLGYAQFLLKQGRTSDSKREFDEAAPFFRHQVAEGAQRLAAFRESLAHAPSAR